MPAFTEDQFMAETTASASGVGMDQVLWISEAGGLEQFGAFIEVLQPGSRSSLKHWHANEDEMVLVLAGEVTLVEGDVETPMRAGDAATFKAGAAVGHCLVNRSAAPTRCLVVGTRAPVDRITYPDHGRVCVRDRSMPDDAWVDLDGQPATPPWRR
jgi:uncharacterized cupin superfamily protein